jgi:hypothetical protein
MRMAMAAEPLSKLIVVLETIDSSNAAVIQPVTFSDRNRLSSHPEDIRDSVYNL